MRKRRRYPVRLLCLRFVLAALFRSPSITTLLKQDILALGPEEEHLYTA